MPDSAHGSLWLILHRHFECVISALLCGRHFFSGPSLHMVYYRMPWYVVWGKIIMALFTTTLCVCLPHWQLYECACFFFVFFWGGGFRWWLHPKCKLSGVGGSVCGCDYTREHWIRSRCTIQLLPKSIVSAWMDCGGANRWYHIEMG